MYKLFWNGTLSQKVSIRIKPLNKMWVGYKNISCTFIHEEICQWNGAFCCV